MVLIQKLLIRVLKGDIPCYILFRESFIEPSTILKLKCMFIAFPRCEVMAMNSPLLPASYV